VIEMGGFSQAFVEPSTGGSGLDAILHSVTFPLNGDGLGVMEETVEDGGGDDAVVVEDRGPALEGLVGGEDDSALLVALANDLEEQVGAVFVDGHKPELINEQ